MTARTLAVIGVGQIGASLGLRLRREGFVTRVVGCGRNRENLETAARLGCVDEYTHSPRMAVRGADLVVVAVPVGAVGAIFAEIAEDLDPAAVVTDVGSVKVHVIAAARQHLRGHARLFVPGHPIAGTERSGAVAADADLFAGRRWVLTPRSGRRGTDPRALALVTAAIEATGAHVECIDAAQHDRTYAWVSHLPHVVAFALARAIAQADPGLLALGGGALRDQLRVAASDAAMWTDILRHNRLPVRRSLRRFADELRALSNLIDDAPALEARLAEIAAAVRAARA